MPKTLRTINTELLLGSHGVHGIEVGGTTSA